MTPRRALAIASAITLSAVLVVVLLVNGQASGSGEPPATAQTVTAPAIPAGQEAVSQATVQAGGREPVLTAAPIRREHTAEGHDDDDD